MGFGNKFIKIIVRKLNQLKYNLKKMKFEKMKYEIKNNYIWISVRDCPHSIVKFLDFLCIVADKGYYKVPIAYKSEIDSILAQYKLDEYLTSVIDIGSSSESEGHGEFPSPSTP